jgi:hypothetical protein
LLGVSSFGSWELEVLTKAKNPTSMHILPLEMKGLVSIMPRLLWMGKKRKIPLSSSINKESHYNKKPQIIATNNSHRRRRKPHSATSKWRACRATTMAINLNTEN